MLARRVAVATAVAALAVATAAARQPPPQTPTFRIRTTLRAIEVRVVDQRGEPITGLRQEDFTIQECATFGAEERRARPIISR